MDVDLRLLLLQRFTTQQAFSPPKRFLLAIDLLGLDDLAGIAAFVVEGGSLPGGGRGVVGGSLALVYQGRELGVGVFIFEDFEPRHTASYGRHWD